MRSTIANTLSLSACMLAGFASAAWTPLEPQLTHLYTVNFTGSAPIDIGPGPLGDLTFTAITGGTFSGPELNGTVVAAGGDWNLQDAQGNYHPEVRETLQTDDGAYIQIYQTGSGPQEGGVAYVHLSFVTGSEKYYWLNKVVAVGILSPVSQTNVVIDAWQIAGTSS